MPLIKSISGIRGTIGGKTGEGLTPIDIVKFSAAYAVWNKRRTGKIRPRIVIGRDARISGEMVNQLVVGTLMGMGVDVINIGLASTPTTEIAVTEEKADGGIILTASHNPKNWNALKLLNNAGEFLSEADGNELLTIIENDSFLFSEVEQLGKISDKFNYDDIHIHKILDLKLVDVEAIRKARFRIAFDGINSVGGTAIPKLLKELGVEQVFELNCDPTGDFAHTAEPLPEHLTDIANLTTKKNAHLGFVVDPDVDRLAIINEDGSMFGEEYTLVAVADYVLSQKSGNSVSNMSSSRALRDVTEKHGGSYTSSAVGEVNVTTQMKATGAIIGGEGNGGVILPELHYGRDAFVGIALFLTHLAKSGLKCSELRATYPNYFISKNKIELTPQIDVDKVLKAIEENYKKQNFKVLTIDGVKIEFEEEWVHLRKSNTEPIIRIYSESKSTERADELAQKIILEIKTLLKNNNQFAHARTKH
jgi:phosphomannomutase